MANAPIRFEISPGQQMILRMQAEYSMETAVAILRWLAVRDQCFIGDDGWQSAGFGNLVEVGIDVQLENIVFRIMCSYEGIFLNRVSGNNNTFHGLCEKSQDLELEAT